HLQAIQLGFDAPGGGLLRLAPQVMAFDELPGLCHESSVLSFQIVYMHRAPACGLGLCRQNTIVRFSCRWSESTRLACFTAIRHLLPSCRRRWAYQPGSARWWSARTSNRTK